MKNPFFGMFKFDTIIETIKAYIDARIQLIKLEIQEKAANVITMVLLAFLMAFGLIMTIIFLSIAVGGLLNQLLNSFFLGYLIVGCIYLLITILLAINIKRGFLHSRIQKATASMFEGKKKE